LTGVVKLTIEVIKETIKQALMTEPSPSRYRLSQLRECLRQQWFEVNEPEPDDNGEPDLMKLGHYASMRLNFTALKGTLTSLSRLTRLWK